MVDDDGQAVLPTEGSQALDFFWFGGEVDLAKDYPSGPEVGEEGSGVGAAWVGEYQQPIEGGHSSSPGVMRSSN